jgi:hypothetical protein
MILEAPFLYLFMKDSFVGRHCDARFLSLIPNSNRSLLCIQPSIWVLGNANPNFDAQP